MTHKTLTQRLTELVTDLSVVTEAANAADRAYNVTVGTPDNFVAFDITNANAVQNNAGMLRSVINGSLLILQMRGKKDDADRMQAIRDIADWNLTETEAMAVRVLANATWWTRNLSRDVNRATRSVCMDFASLPADEVIKDDNLLKAVAELLIQKLSNN